MHRLSRFVAVLLLAGLSLFGCDDGSDEPDAASTDASPETDGGTADAGRGQDSGLDASTVDGGSEDSGADGGGADDGGASDAGPGTVDLPFRAFPSAEGFGAPSVGGRGGRVIQVTNLNDAGPGSLREACEASGPRTVVFRVGGIIIVGSPIAIDDPFITVAGQTAPGDGILIRGDGTRALTLIRVSTNDVVLRHLRLRRGPSTEGGECVGDAIQIIGGDLVVIDHISASWTTDQLLTFWPASRTTVQHSILAEALFNSTHSDDCSASGPLEPHALGPIIGNGSDEVTFYRNVFANNIGRNPAFLNTGGGTMEAVNNLVYNVCYAMQFNGRDDTMRGNAIGNLIMEGPNSCGGHRNNVLLSGDVEMYVRDNLTPARDDGDDEWMATSEFLSNTPAAASFQASTAAETPTTRIMPASEVYANLPDAAGARLAANADGTFRVSIDAPDMRVLADVRSGTDREGTTGRRLDHPDDVGGWPTIADGTAYDDADADGMADTWEARHGLSSSDPDDRNGDPDGDGYTNLEEYLNGTLPG
ncbi:MAG: hypothetical protein AB8I08_19920 [Sandaracinaceae bacterium]